MIGFINIFEILCICILLISCTGDSQSNIPVQDTIEIEDPDEHDAMCVCDECMEEDTLPEIEDTLNN